MIHVPVSPSCTCVNMKMIPLGGCLSISFSCNIRERQVSSISFCCLALNKQQVFHFYLCLCLNLQFSFPNVAIVHYHSLWHYKSTLSGGYNNLPLRELYINSPSQKHWKHKRHQNVGSLCHITNLDLPMQPMRPESPPIWDDWLLSKMKNLSIHYTELLVRCMVYK